LVIVLKVSTERDFYDDPKPTGGPAQAGRRFFRLDEVTRNESKRGRFKMPFVCSHAALIGANAERPIRSAIGLGHPGILAVFPICFGFDRREADPPTADQAGWFSLVMS